jgi:hypothetical protein
MYNCIQLSSYPFIVFIIKIEYIQYDMSIILYNFFIIIIIKAELETRAGKSN